MAYCRYVLTACLQGYIKPFFDFLYCIAESFVSLLEAVFSTFDTLGLVKFRSCSWYTWKRNDVGKQLVILYLLFSHPSNPIFQKMPFKIFSFLLLKTDIMLHYRYELTTMKFF